MDQPVSSQEASIENLNLATATSQSHRHMVQQKSMADLRGSVSSRRPSASHASESGNSVSFLPSTAEARELPPSMDGRQDGPKEESTMLGAWSSLVTNLLSLMVATVGLVLLTIILATVPTTTSQCEQELMPMATHPDSYNFSSDIPFCFMIRSSLQGTLSLMLLFTVVEFSVAISSSVLCWVQAHSYYSR
ncbi:Membrane-spanning 4-domains subfamily A member 6A [Fukomys damarensis]|uniref:Membrane-spanning 4-domains subfamily A member 6A n=1 Tax=Fukomys damarensis TaxID=885580 RepID=A0A091D853_FUKDA|nr:Membrane-spanning 4-domains subfamily A member 6A [Fukomys damarensis]